MSTSHTLQIHVSDCIEKMKALPDGSIGAVITDPPYGLEFMGKDWDRLDLRGSASRPKSSETATSRSTRGMSHGIHAGKPAFDLTVTSQQAMQEWHVNWLQECYRVLRPGGVAKIFSATRTFHRLAAAMEEVGFVLLPEQSLEAWAYGSGFPKSLNLSKAFDKAAGVERPVIGYSAGVAVEDNQGFGGIARGAVGVQQRAAMIPITAPVSIEAQRFEGYGTALKPAWEPFIVGRKPE